MSLKVYLVQWDEQAAVVRSARLVGEGWTVFTESKDGNDAYQQIRRLEPDLVVFDLAVKPSHSLQVAEALRKSRSLDTVPFVFIDGDARALHAAEQRISNAQFTTSDNLVEEIRGMSDRLLSCLA
jgi:CheY-like chemotaxis protein